MEFWILLIVLLVLAAGIYGKIAKVKPDKIRKSKGMRIFLSLILIVIGIWAVGALLSSPIVNAGKYQKLMAVENGEFSKDIEELSFDQIPLLDKDYDTGSRFSRDPWKPENGKYGGYGISV